MRETQEQPPTKWEEVRNLLVERFMPSDYESQNTLALSSRKKQEDESLRYYWTDIVPM